MRFVAYPQGHEPRHVHGFRGETEVIVNIRDDRTVDLADRDDAVRPANAKKSDIRVVLKKAAEHFAELVTLWEEMHE